MAFPKWYNVNVDAQIWSGHSDNHQKMGKLIAPAAIEAIDEYGGSFQFINVMIGVDEGGRDERDPLSSGYPQYWIRKEDTSVEPYDPNPDPEPEPEPEPDKPSNEEIGRVFRYLFRGE